MRYVEVVKWIENYLYLNSGASSKKAAKAAAEKIVVELIDAGVLILSDATPSKRETA